METALMAKIGAACAVGTTGVVVTGCYAGGVFGGKQYGAKKKSVWREKSTTTWDPLEVEKDDYTGDQIGKLYGRYLLGIYGNEKNKQHQKTQWQKLYASATGRKEDDGEEDGFGDSAFVKGRSKQITTHYSEKGDDANKSLNRMCEELYKKTFGELKQQNENGNDENKVRNDLFGYCSTISSSPTVIAESYKNSYGGDQGVISELLNDGVVVTDEMTYHPFWKLQDRWFKALNDEVTDPLFKEHQEKKSADDLDVMRACDAAYKTNKEAENRPSREDVVKYCSFPQVS